MTTERLEAIGQRGEACIILMRRAISPSGDEVETYTLAAGDKLRQTERSGEYTTLDGSRTFRLRAAGRFGFPPAPPSPTDAAFNGPSTEQNPGP